MPQSSLPATPGDRRPCSLGTSQEGQTCRSALRSLQEREVAVKGTGSSRNQSPNPPRWEHLESGQTARLVSPSEAPSRGSAWFSAGAFGTLTCGRPSITAAWEAAQGPGVLARGRLRWCPASPLAAPTSPAPPQPGSSFTFPAWPIPLISQPPLITTTSASSPLCFCFYYRLSAAPFCASSKHARSQQYFFRFYKWFVSIFPASLRLQHYRPAQPAYRELRSRLSEAGYRAS